MSIRRASQSSASEPGSSGEIGLRRCLGRLIAGEIVPEPGAARRPDNLVLAPDLALAGTAASGEGLASRPGCELGDPLADYVELWLTLESFHERASLTEDGWRCLTEDLQRPLELRLAERRPATVKGALKALEMARYLMENLDLAENDELGEWYRRLRNHLVESAHLALEAGLVAGASGYPDAAGTLMCKGATMATDEHRTDGDGIAPEPWQLRIAVEDDALEPLLRKGQTIIVDCSDRRLESGGIYAARDGDALALWLYLVGFSGLGCELGGEAVGTLAVLGGGFRLRGPLAAGAIRVVGRVIEPLTGRRPALADLAAQQQRLGALRGTTRAALLQLPATRRCLPSASSIEEGVSIVQQALADASFADRFMLEQRLDAIDARLALIEELIAETPAVGLDDSLVKLETLAGLGVDGCDALEPRLLHSALDGLRRLAGAGKRPGRETPLGDAGAVLSGAGIGVEAGRAAADRLAEPLELTASPRRRW